MPLGPKRTQLEADLASLVGSPEAPMSGKGLAKALSEFSKGILPPTIGIITGIPIATAVYDSAPAMDKTKGIEDAINAFADANAQGMAVFLFTGTAPPPITGIKQLFEIITKNKGTVSDMAKALSYAILANYTLGRSVFNPLSIPIPTWNIPILPASILDELDQNDINDRLSKAQAQARDLEDTNLNGRLETDEFFRQMNEG